MTTLLDKKIKDSICRARKYLFGNLGEDNLWRDFRTNSHGISVDWASGMIGSQIAEVSSIDGLIPISDALVSRQYPEGSWAYYNGTNEFYKDKKVAPDIDSTSWVAYFLSHFGDKYSLNLNQTEEFLLTHQNPSGSFSTYTEENLRNYKRIPKESSIEGWCGEHPDVTAQTIFALEKIGEDAQIQDAKNYLIESQESDGRVMSYWWTSDIYATALSCELVRDDSFLKRAGNWLAKQNTQIPFYVALQLRGLLKSERHDEKKKTSLNSLLENQNQDGSWKSYPCLRIPHPSNKTPWKDKNAWREEVADQNRLVTTAFCFNALNKYFKEKK